jgi:hypothetical protein
VRGDQNAIATIYPAEEMTGNQAAQIPVSTPSTNLEENVQAANKPGSIIWWVVLLAVYIAWDYFQTRDKIQSALEPSNVRANLHNIVVIGFAAVIFINGMNVLCTKLAALKIPVVSKAAAAMLPLFNL